MISFIYQRMSLPRKSKMLLSGVLRRVSLVSRSPMGLAPLASFSQILRDYIGRRFHLFELSGADSPFVFLKKLRALSIFFFLFSVFPDDFVVMSRLLWFFRFFHKSLMMVEI